MKRENKMKEVMVIENSKNGALVLGKKNEDSGFIQKIEVEQVDSNISFEIEQSGWNEHGFGTDYNSFTLNKEQALALAEKIMKSFN